MDILNSDDLIFTFNSQENIDETQENLWIIMYALCQSYSNSGGNYKKNFEDEKVNISFQNLVDYV